jgi:4-amino-4-deoxy-L-arabinose transferase-like glycosyltransferase
MLAVVLIAVWAAAVVHQIGWNQLYDTLHSEAMPRIVHSHNLDDNKWLNTLLHPFKLFAVNLPWSLFALLSLAHGLARCMNDRERDLLAKMHCWLWPNVVVFTMLPDHGTRHSFPLFPAITILAGLVWGMALERRLPEVLARWHGWVTMATLVFFLGVAIGGGTLAVLLLKHALGLVLLLTLLGTLLLGCGMVAYRRNEMGFVLLCLLGVWCCFKVAHVEAFTPIRSLRDPPGKAAFLQAMIPPGHNLYIVQAKDEGVMFYYDRAVFRLNRWEDLQLGPEPTYCLMNTNEWEKRQYQKGWRVSMLHHVLDEQNDPMVLLGIVSDVYDYPEANRFVPIPLKGRLRHSEAIAIRSR